MKDRAAPLHPRIYRVPPGLSSTKTFVNVGTAAVNGTEISRKSFQIFWKLLNFRIANHSTDSHLEIPGAKLNEKKKKTAGKKFPKIWVYLARSSSFSKFWKLLCYSPDSLLEVVKNSHQTFWLSGKRPVFTGSSVA